MHIVLIKNYESETWRSDQPRRKEQRGAAWNEKTRFIVSLNNIMFSNNFVYILKSHVKIKLLSLSCSAQK